MITKINAISRQAGFKMNKERDMAIIALILGTGIRVSECVRRGFTRS